jgi:hypothetical protein
MLRAAFPDRHTAIDHSTPHMAHEAATRRVLACLVVDGGPPELQKGGKNDPGEGTRGAGDTDRAGQTP